MRARSNQRNDRKGLGDEPRVNRLGLFDRRQIEPFIGFDQQISIRGKKPDLTFGQLEIEDRDSVG